MILERTASTSSDVTPRRRFRWFIIRALDCKDLAAPPQTYELEVGVDFSLEPAQQARISWRENRWSIAAVGSRQTVLVNGTPVAAKVLLDGDVVQCGASVFVVRRAESGSGTVVEAPEAAGALRTVSPQLARDFEVLRKIATAKVPVLLLAEPGSGRRRLARAVHELSGRSGSFEILGDDLRVFERRSDELAGGTLFIDELEALSSDVQSAIRRLMATGEVSIGRPGVSKAIDVRIIAATRRPADYFMRLGTLRRDLYARLHGYELRLPPIRERREDTGLILGEAIRRYAGAGARTISPEAAQALFLYQWPFDVDELEETFANALAAASDEIGLEHLPRHIRAVSAATAILERDRVLAALAKYGGNLSGVARELETSRTQVYRLLARYQIRPHETS